METESKREFKALVTELKRHLKAMDIGYQDLAKKMGTTANAVKKTLNASDCSMVRFMELCAAAGVPYSNVVRVMYERRKIDFEMTEEQEKFFAEDFPSYFFFYLLLCNWNPERIRTTYNLDSTKIDVYLRKLEKIGVITLQDGGGFKLKVPGNTIAWKRGGPLWNKYRKRQIAEFVEHLLENTPDDQHFFQRCQSPMRPDTLRELRAALDRLTIEFTRKANHDVVTAANESELVSATWISGCSKFDSYKNIKL